MDSSKNIERVIIIGGGPAGLSAAIYNARASLNPLVFAGSPPGGQLMLTSEIENFPGYDHIMGAELVNKMREQAKKFGTRILDQNIQKVDFKKKPFEVYTTDKIYKAHTIIITTGAQALWLGLASEQRLRGKGVSACATCDGFFFREKTVAVVGGGDTAMEEANTLTKFAKKVYVIHRRDSFRASKIMQQRVLANPKVEVMWNSSIDEVLGSQKVEGIRVRTGDQVDTVSLDGVFLAIGHRPDTQLFNGQIQLDEKGYVLTSGMIALQMATMVKGSTKKSGAGFNFAYQYMTSVPGVFAAGDNVDHTYRQAATAAGMGVAAALEAERYLENNL